MHLISTDQFQYWSLWIFFTCLKIMFFLKKCRKTDLVGTLYEFEISFASLKTAFPVNSWRWKIHCYKLYRRLPGNCLLSSWFCFSKFCTKKMVQNHCVLCLPFLLLQENCFTLTLVIFWAGTPNPFLLQWSWTRRWWKAWEAPRVSSTRSSVSSATQPFSTSAGNSTGFMPKLIRATLKQERRQVNELLKYFCWKFKAWFKYEHKNLCETKEWNACLIT